MSVTEQWADIAQQNQVLLTQALEKLAAAEHERDRALEQRDQAEHQRDAALVKVDRLGAALYGVLRVDGHLGTCLAGRDMEPCRSECAAVRAALRATKSI